MHHTPEDSCDYTNKREIKKQEGKHPELISLAAKPEVSDTTYSEAKKIDSDGIATPSSHSDPCDLDLSKFRFEMAPDFIGFQLKTKKTTNAKGIIPILRHALEVDSPSFDMLCKSSGGVTDEFNLRIQDPKNPAHVQTVFQRLRHVADDFRLNIIETSLDAFPRKGTTLQDLGWMVVRFAKFMAYKMPGGYSARVYHEKHGTTVPATPESLHRHLMNGYVLAIGNQRDDAKRGTKATPVSFRFYLKTTDKGGKVKLSPEECRARMEVTIQGEALPFSQPDEMNGFNFAKWNSENGFFNFRRLKDGLHPLLRLAGVSHFMPGHFASNPTKARNKGHRSTVADSALNEHVRQAARALSKRWAKASACRNSVKTEAPPPVDIEQTEDLLIPITTKDNSPLTTSSHIQKIRDRFNYQSKTFIPTRDSIRTEKSGKSTTKEIYHQETISRPFRCLFPVIGFSPHLRPYPSQNNDPNLFRSTYLRMTCSIHPYLLQQA